MNNDWQITENILTCDQDISLWMARLPAEGGGILVDKPLHWSSYDVIRFLKPRLKPYKMGHTGTLDPLATGLLIICVGKATRQVPHFQQLPKEYEAVIKLGATTATDDREAPEIVHTSVATINEQQLQHVLQQFIGVIWQVPPAYSAVKVAGQRSYRQVRQGKTVKLRPRRVQIFQIALQHVEPPFITIRVCCGKGVYIRALARDIGKELGTGGYLYRLRRTRIGAYQVQQALTPQQLNDWIQQRG